MQVLDWIGKHGCLVLVLGVFVVVPVVAAIFRAGRARAMQCLRLREIDLHQCGRYLVNTLAASMTKLQRRKRHDL